jgi:antitoxin (DNA-binding transcriptional repressor) of toxin-antitoxin stability system
MRAFLAAFKIDLRYHPDMATIHIPESEVADNLASLLANVRAGAEVVIESDSMPVAVIKAPSSKALTLKERIALLPDDTTAIMDDDFARDVQAGIDAHREPLNPPSWD